MWQNDFEKPVENTLFATYALPLIGLEVPARTHLINNYLYFDQKGVAAQTTSPLQVGQLIATENFTLGSFRFENTVALQQSTRSDVLRLPTWFTKNSVYFSGKVFKNHLEINVGADFRVNSDFRPDGYQPVTWQFHLQDSLSQEPFPWLDMFLTFKIQSFRGFFRYENALTIWKKTDPTAAVLETCLTLIAWLGVYVEPFLPFTAAKICRFLNLSEQDKTAVLRGTYQIPEGKEVNPPELLFEKIDDASIRVQTDKLGY